ncbi:MAG: signal transduction histidine kinase, LytS [Bryobacterales bacterium]|nr:signal transduction histidine kinase, LytS [Bryobacterales bacterium]
MERHLITLLVKLGVAAAISGFVIRYGPLRRMLMREARTLNQRLQLSMWFSGIFASGVAIRALVRSYEAVDLGLEGSLLAGVVGGYVTGLVSGILISIPAMFIHEYLSLPLFAGVGVMGGLVRDVALDKEDIWRVSPLLDISLFRALRKGRDYPRAFLHSFFFGAILLAEFLRQSLGDFFPGNIFKLDDDWPLTAALYATTVFAVTLPLKVWNNTRTEVKLEEQERLLMKARLEALTSQINPHFLFNTLNSVSSLIRTDPQQARVVVLKLSRILRRRLRNHDNFVPLRDELEFISDYLSIEMTRFGEKLRFVKNVDPETLDILVPSMLLQPLVENCIRHGLSSKVEGGIITIETRRLEHRLQIVVQDDGVGISEEKLATLFEQGIGVSNVTERLKVLFGNEHRIWIDSQPGRGTRIAIEIPEPEPTLAAVS